MDNFILVTHKKRSKNKLQCRPDLYHLRSFLPIYNQEAIIRRIISSKLEISSTRLFKAIMAKLNESLKTSETFTDICCFGLGGLFESSFSIYQLALLLSIGKEYNVSMSVNDPIFTLYDIQILDYFKVQVIGDNLEGKYKVKDNDTILFYLPHCSKQLLNNLLWANWHERLNNCVIMGNSFSSIIERCSSDTLRKNAFYIDKIFPYITELPLENIDNFFESFNDTSVHYISKPVEPEIWMNHPDPYYDDEDVEFIRNDFSRNTVIK